MTSSGKSFKNSIQVTTVFFAAVVAFSLQDLLALRPESDGDFLATHRFSFFLMCVFLFLRFLLGSANHLSIEYTQSADNESVSSGWLTFDLSFVTAFGIIGVLICHQTKIEWFIFYHALFLGFGVVWGLIVAFARKSSISEWAIWIVVNLLAAVPLLVAYSSTGSLRDGSPTQLIQLIPAVLAICYGIALFVDFCFIQLPAIRNAQHHSNTT